MSALLDGLHTVGSLNIEAYFAPQRAINDPRFGQVLVLASNSTREEHLMCKTKACATAEEAQAEAALAGVRFALVHPSLLRMLSYSLSYEPRPQVRAYYEFFPQSLAQDIAERRHRQDAYSPKQLRSLVDCLLFSVSFLAAKGMVHGDVRPEMLASCGKRYKLVDRLHSFGSSRDIQRERLARGEVMYASPEAYAALHGKGGAEYCPFKAEVFSAGMALLEAVLLAPPKDIHVPETGTVDAAQLAHALEKALQKVTAPDVACALRMMLKTRERYRPAPSQLASWWVANNADLRKMGAEAERKEEWQPLQHWSTYQGEINDAIIA